MRNGERERCVRTGGGRRGRGAEGGEVRWWPARARPSLSLISPCLNDTGLAAAAAAVVAEFASPCRVRAARADGAAARARAARTAKERMVFCGGRENVRSGRARGAGESKPARTTRFPG